MINKIKKIEALIFEAYSLLSDLLEENNLESNKITRTNKIKRKSRLPEYLQISESMVEYAKANRIGNISNEFERFKNYHISKGTLFADIERAWRTWVSNAITFKSPNIQQPEETRKLVL